MILHRIKTEPLTENSICEKVFIDDIPVRCREYKIEHKLDEIPVITLELPIVPKLDENGVLKIEGLNEAARIMDEDMFNEFCEKWKTFHK